MMVPEALALCETARGVEGKPTLFWKLIPGNADHSPFTKNDVLRYSLDKDIFECVPGAFISPKSNHHCISTQLIFVLIIILCSVVENVDLSAKEMSLIDDNIVQAGVSKGYTLTIHQTKVSTILSV